MQIHQRGACVQIADLCLYYLYPFLGNSLTGQTSRRIFTFIISILYFILSSITYMLYLAIHPFKDHQVLFVHGPN